MVKTEPSSNTNYSQVGPIINYGWVCPKCGRVYSPSTHMCFKCCNEPTELISNITSTNNY